MNQYLQQVSSAARTAASRGQWPIVDACAREILQRDEDNVEGLFLSGLFAKASRQAEQAITAFKKALQIDANRYDAAIELAHIYTDQRRNSEAAAVVQQYESMLGNSPIYLNMAGNIYQGIGMPAQAWAMYRKAADLQPGVALIQENLATTSVFVGKLDEARDLLQELLAASPDHQRNHLSLARLEKATDKSHIEQMLASLQKTNLPDDRNIFMYYALGKEYEDLEEWDEAFRFYRKAGDAVTSVANYNVDSELELLRTAMRVCTKDWFAQCALPVATSYTHSPCFVVGLPRTGTTLVDRIISSHSTVQSVGETQFMQQAIKRASGIASPEKMTPSMMEAAAEQDLQTIGADYLQQMAYRLGEEPVVLDKLPFNVLYLGFIAAAFPDARIVLLRRNPMDSCFAMYKQVFTWAYKFSYSLEALGRFYVTYEALVQHWRDVLGERLVEVQYEALVSEPEPQTRDLLARLELPFEAACLAFEQSSAATTTASSVQVREQMHTRSVDRWRNFATHLRPLAETLQQAGIAID